MHAQDLGQPLYLLANVLTRLEAYNNVRFCEHHDRCMMLVNESLRERNYPNVKK